MSKFFSFFLFLFCLSISNAQNSDIDLLKKINLNRNANFDPFMKGVTNSTFPISIGTPVIIYAVGLIKKDSVTKVKAIFIGETLAASAFVSYALKNTIKRDRPYITYPEIDNVTEESSYSFPSGHTSSAFATATSLSLAYPTVPAHKKDGAITYHLGYARLNDVAVAKAKEVCPEGNE